MANDEEVLIEKEIPIEIKHPSRFNIKDQYLILVWK